MNERQRLISARKRKGISVADVCLETGIDILLIESGEHTPTAKEMIALSRFYGVTMSSLKQSRSRQIIHWLEETIADLGLMR